MRALFALAMLLGSLATVWCAMNFVAAGIQAHETRAELSVFVRFNAVPEKVPEMHASRILHQGRKFGIAGVLMGAATLSMGAAWWVRGRKGAPRQQRA